MKTPSINLSVVAFVTRPRNSNMSFRHYSERKLSSCIIFYLPPCWELNQGPSAPETDILIRNNATQRTATFCCLCICRCVVRQFHFLNNYQMTRHQNSKIQTKFTAAAPPNFAKHARTTARQRTSISSSFFSGTARRICRRSVCFGYDMGKETAIHFKKCETNENC